MVHDSCDFLLSGAIICCGRSTCLENQLFVDYLLPEFSHQKKIKPFHDFPGFSPRNIRFPIFRSGDRQQPTVFRHTQRPECVAAVGNARAILVVPFEIVMFEGFLEHQRLPTIELLDTSQWWLGLPSLMMIDDDNDERMMIARDHRQLLGEIYMQSLIWLFANAKYRHTHTRHLWIIISYNNPSLAIISLLINHQLTINWRLYN